MQSRELQRRRRLVFICITSVGVAIAAFAAAHFLVQLIELFTAFFYSGRKPQEGGMGVYGIFIPVVGGLIVGVMARFGSSAIRGHGIPEAMERILVGESRILKRMTWLKPVSSAIAIGSGGPFGAEGPIIATGAALGSLFGRAPTISNYERKILLACGAAAGMTAIFGTPFSALLLAVELLLFEFRAKSFVPVAIAAVTAGALRFVIEGGEPVFPMTQLMAPQGMAMLFYVSLGLLMGVVSVGVTKIVYGIEDLFEKLPIHWMWWPAIGGVFVGVAGYFEPRSLGVGYENIVDALNASLSLQVLGSLLIWKWFSWSLALGSGTSGGTLAPLLTLGGGLGLALGIYFSGQFPMAGIDPRIAALVGMAALFSGASRALLTSIIFAFEATRQPLGLLPLMGGSSMAYLASIFLMENSIMTEKICRRGIKVPAEYYPEN